MFYHSIFPRQRSILVKRFYQVLSIAFIVYILVTPPNALDPMLRIFINITLFIVPYLGFQFVMDLIRKEPGAGMLIPGYIALALAALNDKLNDWQIIDSITLTPFGAAIFLLSYSILISIRSSQAYARVENLFTELEGKNVRLQESLKTLQENVQLKTELERQKHQQALLEIETEGSVIVRLKLPVTTLKKSRNN